MIRTRTILALLLLLAAVYAVLLPVLTARQTDELAEGQLRNLAYAKAAALEVGFLRAVEDCQALDRAAGPARGVAVVLSKTAPEGLSASYLGCGQGDVPTTPATDQVSFRFRRGETLFVVQLALGGDCRLECVRPLAQLSVKPLTGTPNVASVLIHERGQVLAHPKTFLIGTLADKTFAVEDVAALIDLRAKGMAQVWATDTLVPQPAMAAVAVVRLPLDSGFLGQIVVVPVAEFHAGRNLVLLGLGVLALLALLGALAFRFHRVEGTRMLAGSPGALHHTSLVEDGPGLMLVLENDGRIIYANREARMVLGLPDDQQPPWPPVQQVAIPEDRGRFQQQLRQAVPGNSQAPVVFRVLCADGRIRQARAQLRQIPLGVGTHGVQATILVEDEVTGGSMDAFTAGFSKARVGLVLVDEHFRVRMANQEMARILGVASPEELTGTPFYSGQGSGRVEPDGGASMAAVDSAQPRFFGPIRCTDGQRYAGWAVPLSCREGIPECIITSFMNVEELAANLDRADQRMALLSAGLMAAGAEAWHFDREADSLTVCRPFILGQQHSLDCRPVASWRQGAEALPPELVQALDAVGPDSKRLEVLVPRSGKDGAEGRQLMRGALLGNGRVAGISLGLESQLAELDHLRRDLLVRDLVITQAAVPYFLSDFELGHLHLSAAAARVFGLDSGEEELQMTSPAPLLARMDAASQERLERDFREGRQKGSMLESWFSMAPEFGGSSYSIRALLTHTPGASRPVMVGVLLDRNLL
jgi:PAS domain-containing protein